MTARVVVPAYVRYALAQNGVDFQIEAPGLYTDPAVPSSAFLVSTIVLDANAPAGWTAAIKAAVTQTGVDNGFPTLVVGNCHVPTIA